MKIKASLMITLKKYNVEQISTNQKLICFGIKENNYHFWSFLVLTEKT